MADDKDEQFRRLYAYYDAVVHRFKQQNFSSDEARDLAQETFFRVYQGMGDYRGESCWSYLQTVARRVALNAIRDRSAAKRKAVLVSDDALLGLHDDKAIPADVELEQKGNVARLHRAISRLSRDLQTSVHYWLEGRSYHDMVELLGISESAVKSRLHEARKKLKQLLGEEPVGFRDES